jgi:cbb3-type cytochrome oxidase subunit 3
MLKDVVSKLDYSNFDELALVLFALSFLAIVWGAFRLSKAATDRFSAIPLSDAVQDPFQPSPSPIASTELNKEEIPNEE